MFMTMTMMMTIGLSDADGEAHGEQELSGETPGSGGDTWLDVDNLFGQDGNVDSEPDDRCTYVVRFKHQRGWHQRGPVQFVHLLWPYSISRNLFRIFS